MKRRLLFVPMVVALTWLGCAGPISRSVTKPFVESLEDWPLQYQKNMQRISSFVGKARLTIESPQFSGHLSVTTYWVKPDTFFLKAEGPLGLDMGKIFVGKRRFIVYNQFENQFISGSVDDAYVNRFLNTDIELAQLKQALIGQAPIGANAVRLTDARKGIFSARDSHYEYRFQVNPRTGLVEKWEALQDGKVLFRQEFKNYHSVEGVYMPRIITFTLAERKERLSVYYKEIQINQRIDPSVYTIKVDPKVQQLNVN